MEVVIRGLRFIAENQLISQEELIEGLLKLGCTFSLEDIDKQFPSDITLFEGMRQCYIGTGAALIVNVRDSEYGRSYCDECFLKIDNDTSIYHFIRVVTGDETYTKENIDSSCITNIKKNIRH